MDDSHEAGLLDLQDGLDETHDTRHTEDRSENNWYLFLLTLSIGGLQVVWSVELSNGSPYLLSLGMSKALLAMVWIAGPLTGALVQPYIGILSDNCRLPWGKRKPFMVIGGAATVVSLLGLAWVREIVGGFLGLFGVDSSSTATRTVVIVAATLLMYCLDFSINTVQAGIRAFIVDNAPAHQQESANAWASGLTGAGNILGYISGYLDLPKVLPFFGNTQFKVLCAIASISLSTTLLISCSYVKERDPRLEGPPTSRSFGVFSFFKHVFESVRNLPPQIAKVCEVQVAAWIGWFPFLYYSTTYIGQLYVNPIFEEHPNLPDDKIDDVWEEATRKGTFALLINAVVCFSANIILPFLIVPTYRPTISPTREVPGSPTEDLVQPKRTSFSSAQFGPSSEPLLSTEESREFVPRSKELRLSKIQIPGFTLRRAWLLSHLLFAACMFSTFLIYSPQAATVEIGVLGISWALTLWAPFAFISAEVAKVNAKARIRQTRLETTQSGSDGSNLVPNVDQSNDPSVDDLEIGRGARTKSLGNEDGDGKLAQAGIILGLHNVAISAPQILSSLISSAIFKALQKPRGVPWDDSVGWVLRFAGCAGLLAAWLAKRLSEGA